MITIQGTDSDGVAYEVALLAAGEAVPDGTVYPAEYGEAIVGTEFVCSDLRAADGEAVLISPTGPAVPLSSADPRSVLCWLTANTNVMSILGDLTGAGLAPILVEPVPEGAVF